MGMIPRAFKHPEAVVEPETRADGGIFPDWLQPQDEPE
jgi:hypothetical protein